MVVRATFSLPLTSDDYMSENGDRAVCSQARYALGLRAERITVSISDRHGGGRRKCTIWKGCSQFGAAVDKKTEERLLCAGAMTYIALQDNGNIFILGRTLTRLIEDLLGPCSGENCLHGTLYWKITEEAE